MNRLTFIREASSRIYSPYVFAIGQLLGEIPYSVLCAIIFWVMLVGYPDYNPLSPSERAAFHRYIQYILVKDQLAQMAPASSSLSSLSRNCLQCHLVN